MKVDFKRTLSSYRAAAGRFDDIELPPMQYLQIDGAGDPNVSADYANALAALYPLAYGLKFASKAAGRDYVVPPLEALWWAADMSSFTTNRDKSQWHWTAMIMVPDWLDHDDVDAARRRLASDPPVALDRVRLATLNEGRCIQTLHIGPYDDEGPVLAQLHDEVIADRGLRMVGHHHEIYLGDPRRTAPEKLRTILRQPVQPA